MTASEAEFEPKIIAFVCNWCTYAGADVAGTSRIQYPPNVRLVRLMCSGALAENERPEMLALMQVYNQLWIRQSEALAEAVRRGLRKPMEL